VHRIVLCVDEWYVRTKYAILLTMKKLPIIDVKKYGGKQVAIMDGKIIASGGDAATVLKQAAKLRPRATWRDILLVSVPRGVTVVYKIRTAALFLMGYDFGRTAALKYFPQWNCQ